MRLLLELQADARRRCESAHNVRSWILFDIRIPFDIGHASECQIQQIHEGQ